jgi:hypothetical protein
MDKLCKINFKKDLKDVKSNPNESKVSERFFDIFKTTKIGIIKIDGKEYFIKKESFVKKYPILDSIYKFINIDVNESKFYKKYTKIIKKYKFENNIQLPIKYNICKTYNIYLFHKIEQNLNSYFLIKLNQLKFFNILEQSIMIVYFLNHKLGVFHNDLHQNDKIRNFMVNKIDTKNKILKFKDIVIKKTNFNVIVIDFGFFNKELGLKNKFFYTTKSLKYLYNFEIKSEILIILYIFLINYYKKKSIDFKKFYIYFYNLCKNKNLKEFDRNILLNVKNIRKIIDKL